VAQKGIGAIRDYFRQIEAEGQDHIYEAKLLIVGEAGAGKTSLAKKIEKPDYQLNPDEGSTQGIDITQWEFPMEDGTPFRVNVWDFGGQEIYHATHQFFLTRRSLYALVADSRKEDTDFYYWLNAVDLLSDGSPMLIVKNEKQGRQCQLDEGQLRGQFANLKETLATNLRTNDGLDAVVQNIKHHVQQLPHIGDRLPKTWVRVRQALEQDTCDWIKLDEYIEICQENGFKERSDMLQLSDYLHDLGICLHFQADPLLKNILILNPEWGTDAVYRVLDNRRVIDNQGQFTRADLDQIWDEPEYVDMRDELLRLMVNFKLCYEVSGATGTYIAPQLLSFNQPEYEWDRSDNLILCYSYNDFMPKGIVARLIVAMHREIADQRLVWRNGAVLEHEKTRAEVVANRGRREIKIHVKGQDKKAFLAIVTRELDKIHRSFNRLNWDKLVPCNCQECKDSGEPYFHELKILKKFIEDRQRSIQCQQSYERVDLRGLIDDVIDPKLSDPCQVGQINCRGNISVPGDNNRISYNNCVFN